MSKEYVTHWRSTRFSSLNVCLRVRTHQLDGPARRGSAPVSGPSWSQLVPVGPSLSQFVPVGPMCPTPSVLVGLVRPRQS